MQHSAESDLWLPPNRARFIVAMAVVLAGSVVERVLSLPSMLWKDYDEGLHALLAQLLAAGHQPYAEVFLSYPPLFALSLQLPWQIWGRIEALQLVMVGYSMLGVLAVGYMGYRLNGWVAGASAALFLSFSPQFLQASGQVMTEVPAVSLAALAMSLIVAAYVPIATEPATAWANRRKQLLLFASGLVMCASLMLKIMAPFMLLLLPVMILFQQFGRSGGERSDVRAVVKGFLADALVWAAGGMAPALISVVAYDAHAMFEQVVAYRFTSRIAENGDTTAPLSLVMSFLVAENWMLLLAGAWGIVLRPRNARKLTYVLLWLLLGIAFLLVQVPLRFKHLPVLLPSLAVLAGVGLAEGVRQVGRQTVARRPWRSMGLAAVTAVLAVSWVWPAATALPSIGGQAWQPLDYYQVYQVADRMERYTAPSDCVVSDWPHLPFLTQRPVPPVLSELSYTRLGSQDVTCDDLVKITEASGCQVVVPLAFRLSRNCQEYADWARQHYLRTWNFYAGREAFLALPLANPEPQYALDATFGDGMHVMGYDLARQENENGLAVYLSLYWKPTARVTDNYTILVEVRDAANRVVARGDHEPYGGLVRTKTFPVGETVKDTVRLDLPSEAAGGGLSIYCGLAFAKTGVRLPLRGDVSGEGLLRVGTATPLSR